MTDAVAEPLVAKQDLRGKIHRVERVLEVMDRKRHESLFLQLVTQKVVPLLLEEACSVREVRRSCAAA